MPQHYSIDFQVRLTRNQAATLVWQHLDTSMHEGQWTPISLGSTLGGMTEWTCLHEGRVLSLGWDWQILNDGRLVVDTEVAPRTNIHLLDPAGYDATHQGHIASLWGQILTIPWESECSHWLELELGAATLPRKRTYQI